MKNNTYLENSVKSGSPDLNLTPMNMLHTVVPARASPAPRPAPRRLPVVAVEFTYLKYLNI